ncbi:MAG: glycosyltransferase family A protein, partial [Bacteroidetes bacterium]|nr:glycosyltransferase family A protein [Bacteroidota bacterium]
DDCSTDETWNIVSEYKDKRIVAYRNEKNLREYPNRNKAINLAKGEYLIFIDGDDVIFPTAIEYLLFYANQFPDAALLIQKNYCNNILFPALLTPKQVFCNNYFGKRNLIDSSFTANFFKTDVLKKLGGLSEEYTSGDTEIRLRIAMQYNILLVQGWVSWPRETPNQASSRIDVYKSNIESFAMLELIKNSTVKSADILDEMVTDAVKIKLQTVSLTILYLIKKMQITTALKLKRHFKIGLLSLLQSKKYTSNFKDDFDNYSPKNAYNNEFISICKNRIQ